METEHDILPWNFGQIPYLNLCVVLTVVAYILYDLTACIQPSTASSTLVELEVRQRKRLILKLSPLSPVGILDRDLTGWLEHAVTQVTPVLQLSCHGIGAASSSGRAVARAINVRRRVAMVIAWDLQLNGVCRDSRQQTNWQI